MAARCLPASGLSSFRIYEKDPGPEASLFFANGNMAFSPPFLPVGLKIVDTSSQFECLQP